MESVGVNFRGVGDGEHRLETYTLFANVAFLLLGLRTSADSADGLDVLFSETNFIIYHNKA
ncbi:hypothetical protein D3C75_1257300 [compost metagenome]